MIKIIIDMNTTEQQLDAMAAAIAVLRGEAPQAAPKPAAPSVSSEPVPDAPAAPAPTTSGAEELDSAGVPWDERIHASTKSQNADGTWKKRRGVDPAEVDRVTAELTTAPEAPAAEQSAPVAPPAVPEVPEVPAAPATPESVTPADVFKFITTNKPTPEQSAAALAMVGFSKPNDVFTQPDKAGDYLEALQAVCA